MAQVFTQKTLQAFLAKGGTPETLPADAILTPSARDLLGSSWRKGAAVKSTGAAYNGADLRAQAKAPAAPIVPDYEYHWTAGSDPKTPAEIEKFFNSPAIERIKEQMCDMGRRMWAKDYTDGNGGNLTVRVGDNLVLCTPTLISKGFMTPAHIALIDLDGKQLAGGYRRTSEAMTHLAIMKRQPKAKACCHAHPPHATAFAVAKVKPPTCLIPEAEVFLGAIAMAEYRTPGSPENAQIVGEAGIDNQAILMENHGVITWGKDIEDAYWKMENTDAYCKTIWVASQLGKELTPISGSQAKELIKLRKSLGMDDKRENLKECELCDNSEFRPGFVSYACPVGTRDSVGTPGFDNKAEEVVRIITDQILAKQNG